MNEDNIPSQEEIQNQTQKQPPLAVSDTSSNKSKTGLIIGGLVLLLLIIGLVIFLFSQNVEVTAKIRDVFLIFLALQTFIIGVVLIILVIQVSMLVNLVRNEVKPVIDTTQETVQTLRGTATFLSENLANPVIKSNSIFASFRRFFQLLFPKRSRK